VASSRIDDIPPDVRHEARRALFNFIGCAVGAAAEDAVSIAIRVLMPFAGERQPQYWGARSVSIRCERHW
jgi:2-methylcitrate dehydratase PrpD